MTPPQFTKAEVLAEFDAAWADVAAAKYGDVFDERAEWVIRDLLPRNRESVLEVFRDWLNGGDPATTMLAVRFAARFRLTELLEDIRSLDERISQGLVFHPYYSRWTKSAIASLA